MKKPKIIPLKVDKEKLEQLKKILDDKDEIYFHKRDAIKKLTGMCSICGGIATKILSYDVEGAQLIQKVL